jgi:hypothetical protein
LHRKLDYLYLIWWLYSKTTWYTPTTQNLLPGAKPYYELWLLIEKMEKNGILPKSKKKNKVKLSKSLYLQKK